MQATGRIKAFQIGVCIIMMVDIPVAYLLLKVGYSPVTAVSPSILTNFVALLYRFFLIKKYVPQYSSKDYYLQVVFRALLVLVISVSICWPLSMLFKEGVVKLLSTTLLSLGIMLLIIYLIGLTNSEKKLGASYIIKIRNKVG